MTTRERTGIAVCTDAASPTAGFACPFAVGEQLAGKYEMIELIGAGGIGFVVSAHHRGFDATVALKFLRPELAVNPAVLAAFVREARTGFQIKSEHVVRVLDVDTLGDGTPFIAMELLHGTDLRRLLDRELRVPLARLLDYAQQICAGLEVAHARGVVHCDIKPENVYLADTGSIKLLDFGIAKAGWATVPPRRRANTLAPIGMGTPRYMSPEQMRADGELDARTDLWALGCVMYELLSGTPAFDRPTASQTCAAVLEDEPPALERSCPQLPAAMVAIVSRCLRKDAAQRYASVAVLAADLAAVAEALPAIEPPLHDVASGVRWRPLASPRRRHGGIALAVAACAALAALVWRGVASQRSPRLQHVADAAPVASSPVGECLPLTAAEAGNRVQLERGAETASNPVAPRSPMKYRRRTEPPKTREPTRRAVTDEPDVGY